MTLTELPGPLRWAVWLLGAEGVATAGLALFFGYQAVAAEPASRGDALALAGFLALAALALLGLAVVGLAHRKPRARAPAIVLQLLAVMFAFVLFNSGLPGLAVPVGLLGILVATLLLAPSTSQALAE